MQILKFVLWTWPSASASLADFEASRLAFHRAMAEEKVDGFLDCALFKVDTAPCHLDLDVSAALPEPLAPYRVARTRISPTGE